MLKVLLWPLALVFGVWSLPRSMLAARAARRRLHARPRFVTLLPH